MTSGLKAPSPDRFWMWVNWGILLFVGAADLYLQLGTIPKFEQIYADAFPGAPLPRVTQILIAARFACAALALGWPMLGYGLIRGLKSVAVLWINVGIICLVLQIMVTIYALFLPMMHLPTGGV